MTSKYTVKKRPPRLRVRFILGADDMRGSYHFEPMGDGDLDGHAYTVEITNTVFSDRGECRKVYMPYFVVGEAIGSDEYSRQMHATDFIAERMDTYLHGAPVDQWIHDTSSCVIDTVDVRRQAEAYEDETREAFQHLMMDALIDEAPVHKQDARNVAAVLTRSYEDTYVDVRAALRDARSALMDARHADPLLPSRLMAASRALDDAIDRMDGMESAEILRGNMEIGGTVC